MSLYEQMRRDNARCLTVGKEYLAGLRLVEDAKAERAEKTLNGNGVTSPTALEKKPKTLDQFFEGSNSLQCHMVVKK